MPRSFRPVLAAVVVLGHDRGPAPGRALETRFSGCPPGSAYLALGPDPSGLQRQEPPVRRTMILFAGIAVLALLLVPATSGASGGAGVRAQATSSSGDLQAQGRGIYLQSCAACHGPDPNGPSEYSSVPSLKDVGGAAAVDWAVRTGRMPFQSTTGPAIARGKSHFTEQEVHALSAYVGQAVGDTLVPEVNAGKGDVARGQRLYGQACAACHGMSGAGSALGGENIAPTMLGVSALNEERLNRGGVPIGGKGPVPEGFVAWVIGLGLLVLVVRWLGTRT